ncbi:MAG: hypothetical protein LJE75_12485 [Gammaproteobacteria bacterium]|nr:hypothetical protein [Gammaproteobacteria bacterium]
MQERNKTDRRRSSKNRKFPFRDSDGRVARQERRKLPDRRLAGVEEGWTESLAMPAYLK